MRKLSLLIFIICVGFIAGCGGKSFVQPKLSRDVYNTGGNISFYYDNITNAAIFGGNGEIIQYYEPDVAKGWEEGGNRIGIQIVLPNSVKDASSGSAELNGKDYTSKDYL